MAVLAAPDVDAVGAVALQVYLYALLAWAAWLGLLLRGDPIAGVISGR